MATGGPYIIFVEGLEGDATITSVFLRGWHSSEPKASKELAQEDPRNQTPFPVAELPQSNRMDGASIFSRYLSHRVGWLVCTSGFRPVTHGLRRKKPGDVCLLPPD